MYGYPSREEVSPELRKETASPSLVSEVKNPSSSQNGPGLWSLSLVTEVLIPQNRGLKERR